MARNVSIAVVAALALFGCSKGGGAADMSKGGLELVYDAAPASTDDARATALAEGALKIAQKRLAAAKISAAVRVDGRKLRVGLPAGEAAGKAEEAKKLLGWTGTFEVREVQDAQFVKELGAALGDEGPVKVTQDKWQDATGGPKGCFLVDAVSVDEARKAFPKDKLPSGVDLLPQQGNPGERVLLAAVGAPVVTNEAVASAKGIADPNSTPATYVTLNPEGAKKLQDFTDRIKGKKMAIVLDGVILTLPIVYEPIANGEVPLPQPESGDRMARVRAANLLAAALNAGAFTAPLTLAEERQVAKSR